MSPLTSARIHSPGAEESFTDLRQGAGALWLEARPSSCKLPIRSWPMKHTHPSTTLISVFIATVGILLLAARPSPGQTAAPIQPASVLQSLDRLPERVKPGDTIYVTGPGEAVKGRFIGLSFTSLTLSVDGRHQDLEVARISRIERERSTAKKGALIGFLVGAATFGAVAAAANARCSGVNCNYGPGLSSGTVPLLLVGFGAGAGAGAGAARAGTAPKWPFPPWTAPIGCLRGCRRRAWGSVASKYLPQ